MRLLRNKKVKIFFEELFYVVTVFLLISVVLETIWPRVVLSYINISKMLIFWFSIAIILLIIPNQGDN